MAKPTSSSLWLLDFVVAITSIWACAALVLPGMVGTLLVFATLSAGWLILVFVSIYRLNIGDAHTLFGCLATTVLVPGSLVALALLLFIEMSILGSIRRAYPPPRPLLHNQMEAQSMLPDWYADWKLLKDGKYFLADHEHNIVVVLSTDILPRLSAGQSTAHFSLRGPNRPVLAIGRTPNVLHVFNAEGHLQSFALQPGAARELDQDAHERQLSDMRDLLEPGQQPAFDDWLKVALPAR